MLNKIKQIYKSRNLGMRQVLNNISWLFFDKILQMGLGLIVGVWVARYLGPNQFGLLSYAIAFVSLFNPLISLGLDGIVVRDLARNSEDKDEIIGTSFTLKLLTGLLVIILATSLSFAIKPDNIISNILIVILSIGSVFKSSQVIEFWFQSQVQAKYIVIAKRIVYLGISLVKILLIQAQATVIAFAIVSLAEIVFSSIALMIIYQIKGNKINLWKIRLNRAKLLLTDSWPIFFAGITIYIYSKIDQVMLGSLLEDTSELGFYSVAVKLSEMFDFLPMTINSSVLPKLTSLRKRDPEEYLKKYQNYFDLMLCLWLAVAIPTSLLSPWIINWLYGESYAPSIPILSIYVWAQFGSNFGVARSSYLLIENKQKYSLYFSLSGALINIALNLYLIPIMGATGATIATLATYFFVTILINFLIKDLYQIQIFILNVLNPVGVINRFKELLK
ncbi:flippase [Roseofilum capinflatum]|uniref:Flippase n=1 Tax=Roseofilum capinflatum BLCC-M114 TaxID=3022440 RepID=A0ABT7BAF1_9CYAN|nr:flippase [Roseofilum capinflatum]MDJ1175491.1 flippase [Roseofilum capinflatum BLCC-M114]